MCSADIIISVSEYFLGFTCQKKKEGKVIRRQRPCADTLNVALPASVVYRSVMLAEFHNRQINVFRLFQMIQHFFSHSLYIGGIYKLEIDSRFRVLVNPNDPVRNGERKVLFNRCRLNRMDPFLSQSIKVY